MESALLSGQEKKHQKELVKNVGTLAKQPEALIDFASLPDDVQAEVREKQRQKKLLKKQGKLAKRPLESNQQSVNRPDYPCRITSSEYFEAAMGGLFRDPNFAPTEENLELLLTALASEDDQARMLGSCNYFQFSGPEHLLWDPTFNARLAYEGFFTITTGGWDTTEPLPELQPFYGVLTWPNFESSKYVCKALAQLRKGGRTYRLTNCVDPTRTWKLLDAYHRKKYGINWLTKQYFNMLRLASDDPSINFKMHCIELHLEHESGTECIDDEEASHLQSSQPLAGEIGFSVGRVYTSLSGWTEERTADKIGFAQLVLLGRWLQHRGYAFWSLGHCYSPEMDYKRELGHRVYPRVDFLALLKQYRGDFRQDATAPLDTRLAKFFQPLEGRMTCEAKLLLELV